MSRLPLRGVEHRANKDKRIKSHFSVLLTSAPKKLSDVPFDALQSGAQVEDGLKNNPFVPPANGMCLINLKLPVELLAHIFQLGVGAQRECEDDDEFQEVQDKQEKEGLKEEFKKYREGDFDSDNEDSDRMDVDNESIGTAEDAAIPIVTDEEDPEWEDDSSAGSDSDEEEDDSDDDDEDEDEDEIPFELLVSRVCKHWRQTALSTPDLWSAICFDEPHQWDRYEAYLERAKAQALAIDITIGTDFGQDFVEDTDEGPKLDEDLRPSVQAQKIMDMIVPKASQWQNLVISTDLWYHSRIILEKLHEIPSAPILELFEFHCYEEGVDEDLFSPSDYRDPFYLPFHGIAPNLKRVNLWSIHIDWDGAMSMFKDLQKLELAYHAGDVRPSWRAFSSYLKNSPQLERLELKNSGPSLPNPGSLPQVPATPGAALGSVYYSAAQTSNGDNSESEDPHQWPQYPLELPSIRDLVLSDHLPPYAYALITKLHLPNIRFLSLDYNVEDYTDVVEALTQPLRGVSSKRSVFETLEDLEIVDLGAVRPGAFTSMIDCLSGLKRLALDCDIETDDDDYSVPRKIWKELSSNTKMTYTRKKFQKGGSYPSKAMEVTASGDQPRASSSSSSTTSPSSQVAGPSSTPLPPPLSTTPPTPGPSPATASSTSLLFPNLQRLQIREISSSHLRGFLHRRMKLGAPLKQLIMHHEDHVPPHDEQWFRDNLEEFGYYSDPDEDMIEVSDTESGEFDEDDDEDGDDVSFGGFTSWNDLWVPEVVEGDEDGWEDEDDSQT